jgi:osmotically-inducible protein OsmY
MDHAVLEPEQRERANAYGYVANGHAGSGRRRADRALQDRIEGALGESGYDQLRKLQVAVDAGEVVLRGRLPSYYLTQLALTKAMRVEGVARVRNEIQVSNQLN